MNRTKIETDFLEELFKDDCKCESLSHDYGRVKCSEDVGYLLTVCKGPLKVCTAMGVHALTVMNWSNPCAYCDRRTDKCWTIRPI